MITFILAKYHWEGYSLGEILHTHLAVVYIRHLSTYACICHTCACLSLCNSRQQRFLVFEYPNTGYSNTSHLLSAPPNHHQSLQFFFLFKWQGFYCLLSAVFILRHCYRLLAPLFTSVYFCSRLYVSLSPLSMFLFTSVCILVYAFIPDGACDSLLRESEK